MCERGLSEHFEMGEAITEQNNVEHEQLCVRNASKRSIFRFLEWKFPENKRQAVETDDEPLSGLKECKRLPEEFPVVE